MRRTGGRLNVVRSRLEREGFDQLYIDLSLKMLLKRSNSINHMSIIHILSNHYQSYENICW
jgi:hypothetical protein